MDKNKCPKKCPAEKFFNEYFRKITNFIFCYYYALKFKMKILGRCIIFFGKK